MVDRIIILKYNGSKKKRIKKIELTENSYGGLDQWDI